MTDMLTVDSSEAFEKWIRKEIEDAIVNLVEDGGLKPYVAILKDSHVDRMDVPEGKQEMAAFFVNKANEHEGADGYIFLTETWSITINTPDLGEVEKYIMNPELIVDNPMKEEHLTFDGYGFGDYYSGHIVFTRDDKGEILMGNLKMEEIDEDSKFANVAELLRPMVQ